MFFVCRKGGQEERAKKGRLDGHFLAQLTELFI